MIDEQIKIEINRQVNSEIGILKESLDLINLPLKSQYKILAWQGTSDGTLLTPQFDVNILIGRSIVIKSFRIIPYYPPGLNPMIDIAFSDGTTETIPNSSRINRLFDVGTVGTGVTFLMNGTNVIFDSLIALPLPLDLWIDNIYYKYPQRLGTNAITLSVDGDVVTDLSLGTVAACTVKVIVECYLQ